MRHVSDPFEPEARIVSDSLDVLVVDDEPANLLAIEAALGDLVPRLVLARSGPDALRCLLEQDFALILLDVHMPSMDGLETARLIRERARSRHVPIIFVTAFGQRDERVREGYALGAVDFLFKPLQPEVLRAKAAVFVQLQRRTAEVARQAERLRRHERRQALQQLHEERSQWEQEALRRRMREQARATSELARKAEELARTVAEREAAERELTRINARLKEADRRKDELLATLAHELRNPLAPLAYAVGLLDGVGDPVLSQARVRMERQVSHLSRLVDDLVDVSRVTSGKIQLQLERVDARDVVANAIEASRPLLDERAHRLEVDLPPHPLVVKADAVRLAQVVSNLLNNAARYTPSGGRIAVRAAIDGSEVLLEVKDDGEGIEPELLDSVFGAFVQARAGGGGLGLGLHLVDHLVRLHGGRVRACSCGLGQGATFEVRLLYEEGLELPARRETGETMLPPSAGLKIAVIEDQDDVREMLVLLLSRWGHDVVAVKSGEEGVRLIERERPSVALVDIGLPDIDGYQVAARTRAGLGSRCPPLVAVTGWGQDEDRKRALEAGFVLHLVKPVSPRALRRTLGDLAPRPPESARGLEP